MNKKRVFLAIFAIILAMVFSLALASCNKPDDDGYDSYFEMTRELAEDILSKVEFGNRVYWKEGFEETGYDIGENSMVLYYKHDDGSETYYGGSGDEFYKVRIYQQNDETKREYTRITKWEAWQKLEKERRMLKEQANLVSSDHFVQMIETQKEYGGNFGKIIVTGHGEKEKNAASPHSAYITYSLQIVEGVTAISANLYYTVIDNKVQEMGTFLSNELEGYTPDNLRDFEVENNIVMFEYDRALTMPADKGEDRTASGTVNVNMENSTLPSRLNQTKGAKITLETPEDEGFLGWYYDADLFFPIEGEYQVGYDYSEYSVYAKWQVPALQTELNGGSLSANAQKQLSNCVYIKNVSYVQPFRQGYEFDGWYTDAEFKNPVHNNQDLISADSKVYAKWKKLISITLSADTAYTIPKLVGAQGSSMYLDSFVPSKRGGIFAGWYKDSSFTNPVTEQNFPAANTTYYAKFDPALCVDINFEDATLTIELDYYINIPLSASESFGLAELLEALNTDEYTGGHNSDEGTFTGWYTDKALTQPLKAYPTSNITVYPKIATMYYFVLDAGEGTFHERHDYDKHALCINWWRAKLTPVSEALADIQEKYIIAPEGKSFAGWYTDAALKNPYNPTDYPTQTTTIYAKFA